MGKTGINREGSTRTPVGAMRASTSLSSDSPAIFEFSTQKYHALGDVNCFLVGRHPAADLVLLDLTCSRQQFHIIRQAGQFLLEPMSTNVQTHCDGRALNEPVLLRHGMLIEAGASRFLFLERDDAGLHSQQPTESPASVEPIPLAPSAATLRTVVGMGSEGPDEMAPLSPVTLAGQMLIGRDSQRVKIVLPHARVSRVHARITLQQGAALLTDLHSANGTFVNGRRITGPTLLHPNDRIDIGPYALVFDGQRLLRRSRVDNIELVGRHLTRVVKDAVTDQPLTLLDDVSLVVRPKEFVCVLGPSGCGKSTLLSALSARTPINQGNATINGQDFHANFDALKHDVAVVPQQVALHEALSLETGLLYTAKLRLPSDMSNRERKSTITEMLSTVGLAERRTTRIRDLSGGQLKRASLANEILNKPNLVFIDEVTSGLDEQTDREMMRLFRRIADTGKTVICVTHTSANVEENCDLAVILAGGGKLAFIGSPSEALSYFGIERLGDVYDKLCERTPEQWKTNFLQHDLHREYVEMRLPAESHQNVPSVSRNILPSSRQLGVFLRQTWILLGRYLGLQISDRRSLGTIFLQCLLVAFLLVIFYGDLNQAELTKKVFQCRNIIFLLAISCIWFGCNNSAKEIVKERIIYLRERDVGVTNTGYYASKLLLLGVLCAIQATVLLVIVKYFTNLPGSFFGQWVLLVMLALIGVALGLLISAAANTNDSAIAMVPAALLPQIIFAGVIAPVEGFAKFLAEVFISAYWGYRALAAILPEDICESLGVENWSVAGASSVLLLHLIILIIGAICLLLLADSGSRLTATKAVHRWFR